MHPESAPALASTGRPVHDTQLFMMINISVVITLFIASKAIPPILESRFSLRSIIDAAFVVSIGLFLAFHWGCWWHLRDKGLLASCNGIWPLWYKDAILYWGGNDQLRTRATFKYAMIFSWISGSSAIALGVIDVVFL